jgi:hypothetical protein
MSFLLLSVASDRRISLDAKRQCIAAISRIYRAVPPALIENNVVSVLFDGLYTIAQAYRSMQQPLDFVPHLAELVQAVVTAHRRHIVSIRFVIVPTGCNENGRSRTDRHIQPVVP